jgi:branched-chain amino acid transport system ATP-binding protein
MSILEIKNLTKHFGGLVVLNNVNLNVNQREILGLIGPNGAGKTTLFNTIVGVHRPTSGSIIFDGENISALKPNEIAEKGIVKTNQANVLFRNFNVEKNIVIGHHLQARASLLGNFFNSPSSRKDIEIIRSSSAKILEYFGLASKRNEVAVKLPHGYQRLLGIAIAMAAKPKLLLLDEPTTGMNTEETLQTVELIKGLREAGITIVIIEHDMKVVMNLCERIIVLDFGNKIAEGTPGEIRENRKVVEAYLGTE